MSSYSDTASSIVTCSL